MLLPFGFLSFHVFGSTKSFLFLSVERAVAVGVLAATRFILATLRHQQMFLVAVSAVTIAIAIAVTVTATADIVKYAIMVKGFFAAISSSGSSRHSRIGKGKRTPMMISKVRVFLQEFKYFG